MTTTVARRRYSPIADVLGWLDAETSSLTSYLRVEEFQEDGTYVVRAEMPGVDPDKDVDVTVDGDVLTITAERREEKKERNRSEFRYGAFSRSLRLPTGIKVDEIKASYTDGVLELRVPVDGDADRPVHIAIDRPAA